MDDLEVLKYAINYHENKCEDESCPAAGAREALVNLESDAADLLKSNRELIEANAMLRADLEKAREVIRGLSNRLSEVVQ